MPITIHCVAGLVAAPDADLVGRQFSCQTAHLVRVPWTKYNKTQNNIDDGRFLDPEGGSQKATLVVLLVVTGSLKVRKCLRLS